MGDEGFTTVKINGASWPTMPDGRGMKPASGAESQIIAPAPRLIAVLGNWIAAGKRTAILHAGLGEHMAQDFVRIKMLARDASCRRRVRQVVDADRSDRLSRFLDRLY